MSTSAQVAFKWLHFPLTNWQIAGCNSPHDHDWLMNLVMDLVIELAALCDM